MENVAERFTEVKTEGGTSDLATLVVLQEQFLKSGSGEGCW